MSSFELYAEIEAKYAAKSVELYNDAILQYRSLIVSVEAKLLTTFENNARSELIVVRNCLKIMLDKHIEFRNNACVSANIKK